MKKLFLLIALVFSGLSFSQGMNDYKYALVPARFTIFKNDNYARLNVLAKMYMQKYGFESYITSETQPYDFANTNCNKVFVDLTENNNMFVTKVKVVIKDCNGKIIATSGEGTSREKDLKVAYSEAVRKAFASFPELASHKYSPTAIDGPASEAPIITADVRKGKIEQEPPVQTLPTTQSNASTLYAQPISNGYQLIDSEPKVIMKIYKTSDKNVYTAVKGSIQGVLISKNGGWFFEYYQNDNLVSEKVDVKF